jgi:hypothetical protein
MLNNFYKVNLVFLIMAYVDEFGVTRVVENSFFLSLKDMFTSSFGLKLSLIPLAALIITFFSLKYYKKSKKVLIIYSIIAIIIYILYILFISRIFLRD